MTRTNRFRLYSLFTLVLPLLAEAQPKNVSIRIAQDISWFLDSSETHLVLERKAFKINVLLENVEGVYCFASFNDSIYKITDTVAIPGFADIPKHLLSEADFNKEKELWISNEGWGYWYYRIPPASHRFNKKVVLLDDDRLVASKTIKQVFIPALNKEIKLKDMVQPLYIFFIAVAEAGPDGTPVKELMRRKVRIDWVDEDFGKGPTYNYP